MIIKNYFNQLLIVLTITPLILLGCQSSSSSKQVNETGKLFFHSINDNFPATNKKIEIVIDGKKIDRYEDLDKRGITQQIGGHEIGFLGLPFDSGLNEIDYNIKKDQNFHLYYCELDGSFHGYTQSADGLFHIYQQTSQGSFNEYTQSVEEKKSELKKICKYRKNRKYKNKKSLKL